ncbi:MAG TPA: UDP-2,3-diacylglucosamine diphosphatase, partial [Alcanivorax sp.]|nr:UDP-2,3-diacylglucosamine diphosphatase [Alcanivorax sp.]
FADDCGGVLLDEGTVADLYGTRALLMHGDSLCTEDHAYQQFRAMARDPQWQQGMLAKPLEERRALAQGMRMQSQGNNANKPENIMDVTPAEVVRVMEDAGVRHLIHGHTHRPAVHDVALKDGTGTRWVL